jgi:Na+/H+-dicarboxylate symporter
VNVTGDSTVASLVAKSENEMRYPPEKREEGKKVIG